MRRMLSFGGGDVMSAGVTKGSVLSRIQSRTNNAQAAVDPGNASGDVDVPHAGGNPLAVLLGMIVTLVLLHFVAKANSSINAEFFGFNPINILAIGLLAIVSIAMVKLIVSLWHIPGLTQVAAIV
jgi:hypothetical protein